MAMLNNQRVTWVNDPKLRHWLQRSALRQYQPVVFLNPTWSPSQLTALPRSGELGWSGITWSRIPGKDRFTIFIYIYIYSHWCWWWGWWEWFLQYSYSYYSYSSDDDDGVWPLPIAHLHHQRSQGCQGSTECLPPPCQWTNESRRLN